MEFHCISDCSQCCIEREYYPSKRFGKIGVLILPEEKERIEALANDLDINVMILPRIGTTRNQDAEPDTVIAYQMMGIEKNGNTCPFLDTKSDKRSPHGGFTCKIYEKRPLACRAYPVIESSPLTLDSKCKFCQQYKTADQNLVDETEAILKIKSSMPSDVKAVWRYATGIGEEADRSVIEHGWRSELS